LLFITQRYTEETQRFTEVIIKDKIFTTKKHKEHKRKII
jgi:hypothetical protein